MTSQKFLFIVLLNMILLGMTVPGIARDDGALNQIHRANEHYANSQYEEASGLYQELVDRGVKNGYLFYNLGNAYLRLGEIGPAILNYVRAKQFLPRDEALTANLNHTLQKTEDQLHPPSIKGWSSIFFWVGNFNRSEHLVALAVTNALFWTALAFWIVQRTEFWNLARIAMMTILILTVISFGVKIGMELESTPGVVLAEEIAVKSAQGENNVTLFQLHEGAVVSIIDRKNGWVQIELNDGKKGWAQENFIGV